jgi:hypothetical protein
MQGYIGPMTLAGARVMQQPRYTPAYYKNGKLISQKCDFKVGVNVRGSEEPKVFDCTAWNTQADHVARWAAKGKEFVLVVVEDPYMGTAWNPPVDGQPRSPRLDLSGAEIKQRKTGHKVVWMGYGNDSAKTISTDIQLGMRGPQWNIPGTPDAQAFQNAVNLRKLCLWDGVSDTFLHARVFIPQGVQLAQAGSKDVYKVDAPITEAEYMAKAHAGLNLTKLPVMAPQAAPAPAQGGFAQGAQALPQMVAATLPAQTQAGGFAQANTPTVPQAAGFQQVRNI